MILGVSIVFVLQLLQPCAILFKEVLFYMEKDIFASRFKEAREKKGVTIKEMIPAIGVSPSAMNNYATGKTLPPLEVALRIAEYLGVSLDWLVGRNVRAFRCRSCSDAIHLIGELERCFHHTEFGIEMRNSDGRYLVHIAIESKFLYSFYEKVLDMNKVQKSLPLDLAARMRPILEAAQQKLVDEVIKRQDLIDPKDTGLARI